MNTSMIPWQDVSEDRYAAQEAVITLYAALQIPKPRFAWCPSPATMHRASRMLRTVQHGTAYSMVQSLVPYNPDVIDRESRVALLTAMIDPDVSTQSGGLLINLIASVFGKGDDWPVTVADMRHLIKFAEKDPSGTVAPATFTEQAMYPALYPGLSTPRLSALQRQTTCIIPFTKLCWLCLPPKFVRFNEVGLLHCVDGPAAEWRDGYQIFVDRTPKDALPAETFDTIDGEIVEEPKQLEAGQ